MKNISLNLQKVIVIGIVIVLFLFLISRFVSYTSSPNSSTTPTPTSTPTPIETPLPNPRVLIMDGSTSMVKLMRLLGTGYAQINPNIPTTYGIEDKTPSGSDEGLKRLLNSEVQIAASSRQLTTKEKESPVEITFVPIAHDAIAVIVGVDNPFKAGLTKDQLRGIYQGKTKNWSEIEASLNSPIHVYNRLKGSGTRKSFKDMVLPGEEFPSDDQYFETWQRDETTAVLSKLKSDGIYYATVSQAKKETTVRVVPIDGVDPRNPQTILSKTYPIARDVYLAIPQKTSPAAKQFVDFALSEDGQKLVKEADFVPIK